MARPRRKCGNIFEALQTNYDGNSENEYDISDADDPDFVPNAASKGSSPLDGIPRGNYRKGPASSSVFTCSYCQYSSNRLYNVKRHEGLVHSTSKQEFSCKECGIHVSYSLKYTLQCHIKAVHEGEGYQCHICSRTYETTAGLKHHIATKHKHDDPKVSTKSRLQEQLSTQAMNLQIQYFCCVCNKPFMEEVTWLSHQNTCKDSFTTLCYLCKAPIPCPTELSNHMVDVHGKGDYSCHCGKTFTWKKSFLTHQEKCSQLVHVK